MTAAEWAQRLETKRRSHPNAETHTLRVQEVETIAALLRRAERVEAAARNVLAAADLCDYWYEADIAPLREALEEKA